MSKRRYAVGVDLGGTSIKYGVCSEGGEIIYESTCPSQADRSVKTILKNITGAIDDAVQGVGKKIRLDGVGMGTPGSVDVIRGHLVGNTPNFRHWRDVAIRKVVESHTGLPAFIDNDANMMAYGEAAFGACRNTRNSICITLGTGIGGGILLDGELFRGSHFFGAELGHMCIRYDGNRCRCGGIGCWELYASATAMIAHFNRLDKSREIHSTVQIFKLYDQNDLVAVEVVEQEIRMVAVGLSSIVNIFNPEMIVIGGGVSEAGDWFIERIAEFTTSLVPAPAAAHLEIVPAELGNKAGWLGAASYALHQTTAGKK